MTDLVELLWRGTLLGLGGAALMDGWAWLLRRRFAISGLDYALLGRWVGHLGSGRLRHERIADARPIAHERLLGWAAHLGIAVSFAVALLAVAGPAWLVDPTPGPPMLVALATILAPWFVMQPAMGLGVAASRAARPGTARLRNLATHAAYGLGVYVTAVVAAAMAS